MSFLLDKNKDVRVTLMSELPKDLILHWPSHYYNKREELKQIQADFKLDSLKD